MEQPHIYTLKEIGELIYQTVTNVFNQPFWVVAEINKITYHRSGHTYLELIEKDEKTDNIVAQMRAMVWRSDYEPVIASFEKQTNTKLKQGMKILLLATLNYHKVYGLSLYISAIDPNYTLGDLVKRRKEIIQRLKQQGLLELNKQKPLPFVPQKIAVISSDTAAGLQDFLNQLKNNEYGFAFYTKLFTAYMQGNAAENSIIQALTQIKAEYYRFDIVVILRGGGSKTDLSAFDSEQLAIEVAQFPLPIIVGIGHTTDQSVLDTVAHTSLKTPTAVADFILSAASNYFAKIQQLYNQILSDTEKILNQHKSTLEKLNLKLNHSAKKLIMLYQYDLEKIRSKINNLKNIPNKEKQKLLKLHNSLIQSANKLIWQNSSKIKSLNTALKTAVNQRFTEQKNHLKQLQIFFDQNDPQKILKKGFSITLLNGKAITSADQIPLNSQIKTLLYKGQIISTVKQKNLNND